MTSNSPLTTRRSLAVSVGALASLTSLFYLLALLGDVRLFVVSVPVLTLLYCAVFCFLMTIFAVKLLPSSVSHAYAGKLRRLYAMIFVGMALLLITVVLFSHVELSAASTAPSTSIDKLKSLGYVSYVPGTEREPKQGVLTHLAEMTEPGLNIYNSHIRPGAYLLDMGGRILHAWLPNVPVSIWDFVELCSDGDLLIIFKDLALLRVDWNSKIEWTKKGRFHHDIDIADNDDIYVLSRKEEVLFDSVWPIPCLNDHIVILGPDGSEKNDISMFHLLKDELTTGQSIDIYLWLLDPNDWWRRVMRRGNQASLFLNGTPVDLFHVNTIEIIRRDLNEAFKNGRILFCSKKLNMIGVIDIETQRLVWSWGKGELANPHHPTLMDNGHVLIFDNGSENRPYSRIIELDPTTCDIVWNYQATPRESFYCSWGGANQRFANGNTLITDSGNGRVFEINREGEIVWEFYNPNKQTNGNRETVYRMMRIIDPARAAMVERKLIAIK